MIGIPTRYKMVGSVPFVVVPVLSQRYYQKVDSCNWPNVEEGLKVDYITTTTTTTTTTRVTICTILNHAVVYSHRWKKNLERRLGYSNIIINIIIIIMDANVQGYINAYEPRFGNACPLKNKNQMKQYGKRPSRVWRPKRTVSPGIRVTESHQCLL